MVAISSALISRTSRAAPLATTAAKAPLPASVSKASSASSASVSVTISRAALDSQTYLTMTTRSVAAIPTAELRAISSDIIHALSTAQIRALTTKQVQAMVAGQVAALTTAQLQSLTTAQIHVLSTSDIAALSANQMAAVDARGIGVLSSTQLRTMSNAQLRALSTAQVTALSTQQIMALSSSQAGAFSAGQVRSMSTTQSAVLTNTIAPPTLPSVSGDTNIDTLISGDTSNWWYNPAGTVGTSTTAVGSGASQLTSASSRHVINYSFLTSSAGLSQTDAAGFTAVTAAQKTAVKAAFSYISSLVNVTFNFVSDPSAADIDFGQNFQANSAATAYEPHTNGTNPSYLLLAKNADTNSNFSQGSYGWETLLHEVGHTLGLKHPGNYDANGAPSPGPYLPEATDNRRYSIMSYNDASDSRNVTTKTSSAGTTYTGSIVNPSTFMQYDVASLQYLYGANTSTAAVTKTYSSAFRGMETIWAPKGGTLDASAASKSIIDLRAGAFSSINILASPAKLLPLAPSAVKDWQTYTGYNNVAMAYGSKIGTVKTGQSDDAIYIATNNVTVDGGAGNDAVYLPGSSSDWTITTKGTQKVAYNRQLNLTNLLKNIETISYYDSATTAMVQTA